MRRVSFALAYGSEFIAFGCAHVIQVRLRLGKEGGREGGRDVDLIVDDINGSVVTDNVVTKHENMRYE